MQILLKNNTSDITACKEGRGGAGFQPLKAKNQINLFLETKRALNFTRLVI